MREKRKGVERERERNGAKRRKGRLKEIQERGDNLDGRRDSGGRPGTDGNKRVRVETEETKMHVKERDRGNQGKNDRERQKRQRNEEMKQRR